MCVQLQAVADGSEETLAQVSQVCLLLVYSAMHSRQPPETPVTDRFWQETCSGIQDGTWGDLGLYGVQEISKLRSEKTALERCAPC